MEAACTAAEVGCTTFLLEKKPYLGGLAAEISKIPDKKRLADFPNYMIHRTNNLKNLFAFTNTDANVDFIKNLKPNIIVNATGSSPLLPPIPGLHENIDKEGGITSDDCADVSREMNEILDREDYVEGSYTFEVSSPGLGRPLKKEKDYIRSMGKELEIRTYRAIDREKEFYGILKAYDADTVTIEQEDGKEMVFEKSNIALIRLAFDF